MNWQRMANAPKDGEPFLAWYEGDFGPPYGTMVWRPEGGGRFHSMTMGTQTKNATYWARPEAPLLGAVMWTHKNCTVPGLCLEFCGQIKCLEGGQP